VDYAALRNEITTDPLGLGYAGKGDDQVAGLLDAPNSAYVAVTPQVPLNLVLKWAAGGPHQKLQDYAGGTANHPVLRSMCLTALQILGGAAGYFDLSDLGLNNESTTAPGMLQILAGQNTFGTLPTPAAPTVTPTGTAGTKTYYYQVVARNANGRTAGYAGTPPGAGVGSTTTGNTTLTAANYNAMSWAAVAGAVSYDVLKWSGTAWVLLGNVTGTSLNDTGQATSAYAVPTANTAVTAVSVLSQADKTNLQALQNVSPASRAEVLFGVGTVIAARDVAVALGRAS
jgi:hypothetical protein